jgi:HEAT repeat protein
MSEVPKSEDEAYDPENDPRSNEELIAAALIEMDEEETEDDDSTSSKARYILCRRCNRDVLEAAKTLLKSANSKERQLGADILGNLGTWINAKPDSPDILEHLGNYVYPFAKESGDALLETLENEEDPYVLWLIGIGLGRLEDKRAVEPLIRHKNHPNSCVRYGVVMGLWGCEDERAIETLIELMQDDDVDVRDWATCNVGSMLEEIDTPEIRAALYRNIDDEDEVTRNEAINGLLNRRVLDIVPRVLDEISSGNAEIGSSYGFGGDFVEMLYVMRDEIDDPRLGPIIEKALEFYPWLTTFDEDNA